MKFFVSSGEASGDLHLSYLVKSIKARFYICRVLDLFFCISAIFTVYRSFGYLISRKIIKDSAYLDYIFYIAAFSQEFFIRSFVVTNDSLMYLLTALCFFFLLKRWVCVPIVTIFFLILKI